MESSEDDAGAATNASCRASARERDMGDVDATTSFHQDSSEARTSCGTPAMSDVDSVPSPSAHDVNTSTEAILDMIDEFVDGPGAPKRLPLRSYEISFDELRLHNRNEEHLELNLSISDDQNSQTSLFSLETERSEIVSETTSNIQKQEKSPAELTETAENSSCLEITPTVSTITESVRAVPEVVSTFSVNETPDSAPMLSNRDSQSVSVLKSDSVPLSDSEPISDSVPTSDSLPTSDPTVTHSVVESEMTIPQVSPVQETTVESVPLVQETLLSNLFTDFEDVASVELSKSVVPPETTTTTKVIVSNEYKQTVTSPVPSVSIETIENLATECQSATICAVSVVEAEKDCSSSVTETVNETPVECQIPTVCESVTNTPTSCPPVDEQVNIVIPEPIQVTPSSSEVNTISDSSVCQLEQRTVKCDTSSANRDTVTVENAESTSSDPKFEEKSSSSAGKTPLRRRLVRPAPSDRKPDTTVSSSTTDSQASDTTAKVQVSIESVAKSVSSSSDSVKPFQGIVNEEVAVPSNASEISVCKAETSSPAKKIKLIRQKTASPIPATSSSIIEKRDSSNEQEPCQSTSDNLLLLSRNTELRKLIAAKDEPSSVEIKPDLVVATDAEERLQEKSTPEPQLVNETDSNTEEKKVPPLKLNLSVSNTSDSIKTESIPNSEQQCSFESTDVRTEIETTKQVPKLTIKLGSIQQEEVKSPIPKLTIKPIQPPSVPNDDSKDVCVEQFPFVTKINIKPIIKPPEKKIEIHRKSSSSEISESESSETDDTSTSDQASTSDHGPSDIVPKVTIKVGKPGTTIEGKFYTQQNVPKLTIKNIQHNETENQELVSKLKLVISQPEEKQPEKIPKLTIKTLTGKCEGQPMSPKLTIKPILPHDRVNIDKVDQLEAQPIPKLKINTESFASVSEIKENLHVPKITIKPITRSDGDSSLKVSKKSSLVFDGTDHIPAVTKLNIKPIVRPESNEITEKLDDKVPVVSKLNIKPIVKPHEIDSYVDDVPKVAKLNIKITKNAGDNSLEVKDCDEWVARNDENSIPVVTKINIKPIIKPQDEDSMKDSENQSSETGNSSDDYADSIPVVTKINIKPILKPEHEYRKLSDDESIPIVTKLNIKPVVKPEEALLSSPKKVTIKPAEIPIVTKLNIKPVIKPEDIDYKNKEVDEALVKNPPLLMKINMKAMTESVEESTSAEKKVNHVGEETAIMYNNITENIPVVSKLNIKPIPKPVDAKTSERNAHDLTTRKGMASINIMQQIIDKSAPVQENFSQQNCVSLEESLSSLNEDICSKNELSDKKRESMHSSVINQTTNKVIPQQIPSLQNCTLLKKLLETKNDIMDNKLMNDVKLRSRNNSPVSSKMETAVQNCEIKDPEIHMEKIAQDHKKEKSKPLVETNDVICLPVTTKTPATLENCHVLNESVTKPLEISISDKITNQSSGQDSPRIILKINKTDHGASAKIITEETRRPESPQTSIKLENTHELENNKDSLKRTFVNSRRKANTETSPSMPVGKRLRSSRVVKDTDKTPVQKRNVGMTPSTPTLSSPTKEPELSVLESKRLKLGQLLSNKSLSITPVAAKVAAMSPPNKPCIDIKESEKTANHSLLNNENRSKNGNSKLHNILSNLHSKQIQVNSINDVTCSDKSDSATPDLNCNTSTSCSSDVVEVAPVEKNHPEVQEMLIGENSESRDFPAANNELLQDPLEVETLKNRNDVTNESINIPDPMLTPVPKKRGRPRKQPLSEGARPVTLPTPALEERPVRSLRLSRERPAILVKPRGRGRGRGAKRSNPSPQEERIVDAANRLFNESPLADDIDPTSSRIKLPRMTEALDKSVCSTPLSSRRRSSDLKLFGETPELKVVLEGITDMKSPEPTGRGRGGRGRGRGRTPRGRGRARGGGKGAVYMKETMGIYGRVCGPATTTVELFEEETCMMDDNACTPAKPSNILDEDSQSSVKSSTNESSKMRKSKFADLFDSSKVWMAADVKEYKWPPPETSDVKSHVMMVQEQVAMFLGVKSFKRRYPELVRRAIVGEEKDYLLSQGLVTEALCDLGITAVDASDVLDIMLSDYPHKYEEYRSHQRQRQIADLTQVHTNPEIKPEVKGEKMEPKPEPPKVDPVKARQEMAAAAIASASEFNSRMNASRRTACVDLQSLTICRRRTPQVPGPSTAPLYPHALLPGQYQHYYKTYTSEQLRYFPLNTVLAAPPRAPSPVPSSSDSGGEWGSRTDSSDDGFTMPTPKRKKLTKVKRSSKTEPEPPMKEEVKVEQEVELCRICKLREDVNRKYPERFLTCATCNKKLHPSCVEMSGDTSRKAREYSWRCGDCKLCLVCAAAAPPSASLYCHLCDIAAHLRCLGLLTPPPGRWHCTDCAICKSCGTRSASGPALVGGPSTGQAEAPSTGQAGAPSTGQMVAPDAQWHHQTKRGPGGHKVFSHSLCTPCARAYRIGRYCPLCERSFIGPKGTMQLVICKLCDRQLHQECVRQSVSNLNVMDYTCGECRRGGITSRAAAVRVAPRTIATLFMAKRRFNKYAHKQYMQRRREKATDPEDAEPETEPVEAILPDESSEPAEAASEGSASDPLEGVGNPDETTAAVEALQRDFGD